eukprot:3469645-Pyramimonas_sp.AAC.1
MPSESCRTPAGREPLGLHWDPIGFHGDRIGFYLDFTGLRRGPIEFYGRSYKIPKGSCAIPRTSDRFPQLS